MRETVKSIVTATRKNILLLGLLIGVAAFGALAFKAAAGSSVVSDEKGLAHQRSMSDGKVEPDETGIIEVPESQLAGLDRANATATRLDAPSGVGFVNEVEPNGTPATATPITGTAAAVRGNVFPNADQDYYSFTAAAGDRVYAAVMTSGSANASSDSQLRVFASDGTTELEFDDDDGVLGGLSSSIAGRTIPSAGTYYFRVNHFSATNQLRPYDLYFRLQSGAPTAEVEVNDTPATANPLPGSGWVSGVRSPAAATEQDWFSFTAAAGDTVYLGLDLDPERDNVQWNGRLGIALFGDANNQILVVDDASTGSATNPLSEAMYMTIKTAGTYYAFVDSSSAATGGATATYNLSVTVFPAANEGVNCTTYTSTNVPQTIGPGAGLVSSTITVPGNPRIADLDVDIQLNHALMGDIDAHLRSPQGNDNGLFSDIGAAAIGGQTQMDATFDDEAAIPPAFTVLRPIALQPELAYRLNWFDGEDAGGVWTLDLRDDGANASGGTLTGWSLRICEQPPAAACPPGFAPQTVYSNDFEANDGGFTHSGAIDEWERGLPSFAPITTCASGVNCWKTDLDNTYNAGVAAGSPQDLLSPSINLAGLSAPIVVNWAQRYQIENTSFDRAFVDIQQVGGATPVRLWEWLGATMTDTIGNPAVTIQESAGWGRYSRRADSLAGLNTELRFNLTADDSVQLTGLAIDDVSVTGCVAASADLAITKTDGVTTAVPGGSVTYTITASNAGPAGVTGATVADTFPAVLTGTWTCVGAGGGTCTAAGAGNINDTVNLPAGGSVTYTVSAAISASATGTLSNTATVSSATTDPNPANNSATDTDTLTPQADLAITKTDGVSTYTAGGSTTYTITASNAGPSNAPGTTVADTFPANIASVAWTCVGAGGGTCTAGGTGNINQTVNLPAGGSVTFTAVSTISGAPVGNLVNTATVAAAGGITDPNPGNNSATDTDTLFVPSACGDVISTITQSTPTAIPTGPAVVTSTLVVSGAATYLTDLNLTTNLTHTFAADLDITITSPAGTVVTLTTDNGAGNDNVFNGTVWDDDGAAPASDHVYVNLTTAASLIPEEAFGAFIGEDPNGTWTITISDDLTGDGGSLDSWSMELITVGSPPVVTTVPTATNSTPTAILDVSTVTSTLVVAGAGTSIYDVDLTTFITHTFAADMDITLTSPAGTVVTLTTDNGAGNDDVFNGTVWNDDANPAGQVPYVTNNGLVTDHAYVNLTAATPLVTEGAMSAFYGEDPNGTWTITITDDLTGDTGTLNSWSLDIDTFQCVTPTTTTVTSSQNPSLFGQNVTFTATVAPVPSGGTVQFVIDGSNAGAPVPVNGSGQATFSTSALAVGNHTVVANYGGNGVFLASSGTLTGGQNVGKANTTTTVTAVPVSPSVFGQSVTFTATVAAVAPGAGTPAGTVSFNIDGTIYCANTPLNGSGVATCTQAGLPALPAGLRNVVALYSGNASFNGSAGTNNYTVNKASTTIAITGDTPDPTIIGQPYAVTWATTVTAPGAGTPTGTVTVSDGSATCSAPVGAGTCNLTSTTSGNKLLFATYAGDANFNGSVSTPGVPHVVNMSISGTVRDGITLVPAAGQPMTLLCASPAASSATANASGVFTFTGQFTGPCELFPNTNFSEPFSRFFTPTGNITGADFLVWATAGGFPRTFRFPTQYVVPGAAGSMPIIMNSLNNEASVAFSFTYDINPFSQPPVVVCGADAPGCTVTNNTSVFGRVGFTVTAAPGGFSRPNGTPLDAPEGSGPKEIARINFQTAVTTTLPSTDFIVQNSPTAFSITEVGTPNSLTAVFLTGARVVFAQGREGDVAGRNAGNGAYEAADLVQMRRFISGLDTPVGTHNEYQRADTAPAASKGDGTLNATDLVQARRYVAGLDAGQSAGGAGAAAPAPMAPPAPDRAEAESEITIGDAIATNSTRISVPVSMKTSGTEVATSFTIRYDETRLTNPNVTLADGAPEGAVLTFGKAEPGYLRILIDSTTPFGNSKNARLVDISFDVLERAPSGDTGIEIEELVFSDAGANQTRSRATNGTISIAGSIPADTETDRALTRVRRPTVDLIEEWLDNNIVTLRPREAGETQQQRTITRGRFQK